MLDFTTMSVKNSPKGNKTSIHCDYTIMESSDLMIRGGDFYAIWLEDKGVWSTNEIDAIIEIDKMSQYYANDYAKQHPEREVSVDYVQNSASGLIDKWHKYCQRQMRDNYIALDKKLIFANDPINKNDFATKRLPYPLEDKDIPNYNALMDVLYAPEERHKIEWCIGAIVTGESKWIQKFLVLYGAAGTGKSTVLNIVQKLFDGYYSVFDSRALGSANNVFALESFKSNPLVAIQHDGDLSRIEDNTRLNSLVSHEKMTVNEKFKATYEEKIESFIMMGTNKPVKITDAKSGLLRRLIDATPTGNKLDFKEFRRLEKAIDFELGGIANHCKNVYLADTEYYDDYIPVRMIDESNDFYNFMLENYFDFKEMESIPLRAAWERYNLYCEEAKVPYPLSKRNFKFEFGNYFDNCDDEGFDENGRKVKTVFSGFKTTTFKSDEEKKKRVTAKKDEWLIFNDQPSYFDNICKDELAQYANENETPSYKWSMIKTKLKDINTHTLHYVKVPENHIVIDFDIPDENGNKCFERNFEEARKWPKTYAELSKSGEGIHLHYIYTGGDPKQLSRIFDDKVEIKVFTGNSSLRRKLTKCNDIPIAEISSGLPLREESKMVNFESVKSEKALRTLIKRNLNKEYHANTAPSVLFIETILKEAYDSGLRYDVSDMRNAILAFAAKSTHQSDYLINKVIPKMKFKSEEPADDVSDNTIPIAFWDIEVFPNLLLINFKTPGENVPVIRMINPKPDEIESLLNYRLIGFNCRRYDNHILYAALMGYSNEELYNLSQRIVNGDTKAYFREAYNISYTDIYDFAAKKQSLKKWEIELKIKHQELGLPWDQPVDKKLWAKVAEYCDNDVISTEALFNHLQGDWTARLILVDLVKAKGLDACPNDTTNSLTTKLIFGKEKNPKLIYTDFATGESRDYANEIVTKDINKNNKFEGYKFEFDTKDKHFHNLYRGTDMGFGGYIISNPGIYHNVALLDVQSLHPNSIRAMQCFGEYTKTYTDLIDARVAIKHKDYEKAKGMFDGGLAPYLKDDKQAKSLSYALKIAINSVYGLTSAGFANPFKDSRNTNNIVALRGALFMRTLQDEVESRGFKIVAIKTDSIKIVDATKDILEFCMKFAKEYGYVFEHEATYEKICQLNDADYVARYLPYDNCKSLYGDDYVSKYDACGSNKEEGGKWTVTGAFFAKPYVFKKLFSHEKIDFDDLCEVKECKTALYLDMNESKEDVSSYENEKDIRKKIANGKSAKQIYPDLSDEDLEKEIDKGHNYIFIGKVGQFTPVMGGNGAGLLMRIEKDGRYSSVAGTKGYRWMESTMVENLEKKDQIDMKYYTSQVDEALDEINKLGDAEMFLSTDIPKAKDWRSEIIENNAKALDILAKSDPLPPDFLDVRKN